MAAGRGICAQTIPSQARRTRPCAMSVVMIPRVVSLMGTARPTPMPATAVLTPITCPELSASAPPLFPGLSAASVWITSSTTRPARVGRERPSADTMPAVTLPASPSGLPNATTSCPTRSLAASPSSTGGGTAPRALRTARSDSGSRPITFDHVRADYRPVGESRLSRIGTLDHVCAGQQESICGQDAGAARAVASSCFHSEAGNTGEHTLSDTDQGASVRVKRFEIVGHRNGTTQVAAVTPPTQLAIRVYFAL